MRAILLALLGLGLASVASAQTATCETETCRFTWTPSTGAPVGGYTVWTKRGSATVFTQEMETTTNSAALPSTKDETVVVRVYAWEANTNPRKLSASSPESDVTTFRPPTKLTAPGQPALVP